MQWVKNCDCVPIQLSLGNILRSTEEQVKWQSEIRGEDKSVKGIEGKQVLAITSVGEENGRGAEIITQQQVEEERLHGGRNISLLPIVNETSIASMQESNSLLRDL